MLEYMRGDPDSWTDYIEINKEYLQTALGKFMLSIVHLLHLGAQAYSDR